MNVRRERFLVLAAALSACHQASSDRGDEQASTSSTTPLRLAAPPLTAPPPTLVAPQPPSAAPSAPAPSASGASSATPAPSSSAAVAVPSQCAPLLEKNREILAHPSGDCSAQPTDGTGIDPTVVIGGLRALGQDGFFALCRVGHGTWAVSVLKAALSAPGGESGISCGATVTYSLVYLSPTGERAVSAPSEWTAFRDEKKESHVEAQFDFDGDGRDELVVSSEEWENGFPAVDSMRVLRSTGSVIGDYPIGFPVDETTDADGDGRPDFVSDGYFSCGMSGQTRHGAPLLVHSLPDGKFTMSDELSRRWARRECPDPPAGSLRRDPSCARLWGRSIEDIAQGAPDGGEPCDQLTVDEIRQLLRRPPPFKSMRVDPVAALAPTWPRSGE